MNTKLAPSTAVDLAPLTRIRVETALSRFPVHRLAKKGIIAIDLQHSTDGLEANFRWKVSHNSQFGQPGPLAYKVDTLTVNRRIDEAPRPLPEFIKLGSLREICREVGLTDHNTDMVKSALHQNASAYITAKIRYKTKSGRERWGEIGYTRYSVIFTGEKLPDGREAEAVYIVINPSFRDLLNHVEVRPLDYDYLVKLAPGPQRLYELLSFQIYGALASGRPRAKMLYSEYCKYAPQTQYPDFDHVKKQMYKVHLPHRESGYILKVDYQQITSDDGQPDWEMFYTPGPKAEAEYRAFTNRLIRQRGAGEPSIPPLPIVEQHTKPVQTLLELSESDNPLLRELIRHGITEKKARTLLANLKPAQEVMDQLEYVDHLIAQAPRGKFHNPSGLIIKFIEDNAPVPDGFITTRKKRLYDEAQQAKSAEGARRAQLQIDYEEYCRAEVERFISNVLPAEEYQQLFGKHRRQNSTLFPSRTPEQLDEITQGTLHAEIKQSCSVQLLSFAKFCSQHSPKK